MSPLRIALAGTACLVVLAAGCGSCADRAKMDAGAPDAGIPDAGRIPTAGVLPAYLTRLGHLDLYNHYNYAVLVGLVPAPDEATHWECSGVLIASNLVLTAAHCVCTPTPGQTLRFDGSACAATAMVRIHTSVPPIEGVSSATEYDRTGNISVHPQFELVLDAQGAIVTSRADLAVIRVENPPPSKSQPAPARLATEDVKNGEELAIAGFPSIEGGGLSSLLRSVSHETVGWPAGDDTYFFGSEKDASYKGDMGGPCLRETERGRELVGISQRGLGLKSTLTRIVPYRGWIEDQIRLASGKRP